MAKPSEILLRLADIDQLCGTVNQSTGKFLTTWLNSSQATIDSLRKTEWRIFQCCASCKFRVPHPKSRNLQSGRLKFHDEQRLKKAANANKHVAHRT